MTNDEIRERFAALAHEQWSGWMKYLFEKSFPNNDGSFYIPKWAVDRWTRQMNTPYDNLSEKEKDLDRIEAEKIMATILDCASEQVAEPDPKGRGDNLEATR
jgi:hypothetical protein